jgi:hypothetical protein
MRYFWRKLSPFPPVLILACLLLLSCGSNTTMTPSTASPQAKGTTGAVKTGVPSSSLQISGLVTHPGTFTLQELQSFPQTTVSIRATPIGSHTFAGALLYTVLQKTEVTTLAGRKNDLLRKSIVVSGTDGYTVAVAWGEIDPQFAHKQVLLAYEEDGKPLPQADGFARLIVPGDAFAGRYVSNVSSIVVRDPGVLPAPGQRHPSQSFYLVGLVNTPAKYDLGALKALPSSSTTVNGTTYSGVLLNTLLDQAGLQLKPKKNDFLHKAIVATGSDGYSCVVADGELQAHFGNVPILVAYNINGKALPESDGFARLVVPGDQRMGRFVSNLVELQVVELVS